MRECVRKPYTQHAARAQAEKAGKGYFRCQWCGDWHTGWDPGPVAPCCRCGTLVTIPDRGTPWTLPAADSMTWPTVSGRWPDAIPQVVPG